MIHTVICQYVIIMDIIMMIIMIIIIVHIYIYIYIHTYNITMRPGRSHGRRQRCGSRGASKSRLGLGSKCSSIIRY